MDGISENLKPLCEMSTEELWQLFPIILTGHKDYWGKWYLDEKATLKTFLPQTAKIHHIGSTAINTIHVIFWLRFPPRII